ncbi:MAG TPA: fluoride efflux transporter CrcB [Chloroflexia bacterium]|nr:fluoride efflux transporter CrcB [Chloroflexia bacterium]
MRKYLVVEAGGALGAISRYLLSNIIKTPASGFPAGTFFINLTGSFVLALFLTLIIERYTVSSEWRLFFASGFVGAYTTFSTFSLETFTLFRENRLTIGLLYSAGSLIGGLACAFSGLLLARLIAFHHFNKTLEEELSLLEHEAASLEHLRLYGIKKIGPLPSEEGSELEVD